jgi:putative sterol carrier protein
MADINSIEADMKKRIEGKKAIGKVITFNIKDEGKLYLDARADPISITREEMKGDVELGLSAADLAGLLDGSVNGQSLMMTGRAKMTGNPAVVMKLRDLLM